MKLPPYIENSLKAAKLIEQKNKPLIDLSFRTAGAQTNELLVAQNKILEDLRKPHWSAVPAFWLLVTSVLLSFVAAVAGVLSLPQVQQFLSSNQKQQKAILPAEKIPKSSLQSLQNSIPTQHGKQ